MVRIALELVRIVPLETHGAVQGEENTSASTSMHFTYIVHFIWIELHMV